MVDSKESLTCRYFVRMHPLGNMIWICMNCSICSILRAQSLKHQVSRLQEQRARIQWWNKGHQSTPARWFPQSRTAPSIPCRQHLPERLVLYPIHLWTKSIETHRTTTFMVEVLLVKPGQTLQPTNHGQSQQTIQPSSATVVDGSRRCLELTSVVDANPQRRCRCSWPAQSQPESRLHGLREIAAEFAWTTRFHITVAYNTL